MKRLSIVIIVALVAALVGGCRFAVVESDSIRVCAGALAEEAGDDALFVIDEVQVDELNDQEKAAVAQAVEAGKKQAKDGESGDEAPKDADADDEDEEDDEESSLIGLHSRDDVGETRVLTLQKLLAEKGYLDADDADGVFGSRTLKALKRFQHDNDLETTGVLDDATKLKLYPQPEVTTAPEDVLYRQGASGEEIETLRRMLAQYGFSERPVSEEYDEATAEEVMAFQVYAVKNYGTEFDDPVDVDSLPEEPALVASQAELPTSAPTPAPTPAPPEGLPEMPVPEPAATLRPYHAVDGVVSRNLYAYLLSGRFPTYRETVQRGDSGEEVLRVQRRLINMEYLYEEASGEYDADTIDAMKFFQRRNGLQQTGIADAETQRLMFSAEGLPAEQVEQPFYIKVSLDDQRVYVYRWDDGDYRHLIKTMICSTGLGNSTPSGVFVSPGHRDSRWHYFVDFHCWAQYAFVIRGNILFHSVLYSSRSEDSIRMSSVYNLGHKASHGCVRLPVADAKWIYEHCGSGQVIEIY